MKRNRNSVLSVLMVLLLVIAGCNNDHYSGITEKFGSKDPFKKHMEESQFFKVDAASDHVIEGNDGTIIALPKGCFVDDQGNEIEAEVKVELTEALSMEKMLLSNLTTSSNGKPLRTDGMIYFNATSGGKQVYINRKNPVLVEIPTRKKIPGMQLYKGVRDEKGNMNWIDPVPLKKFLITVPLDELDFLPPGFAKAVEQGLPFRTYQSATKDLCDSLYYNLVPVSRIAGPAPAYIPNEPMDNHNTHAAHETASGRVSLHHEPASCGIEPSKVAALKDERFKRTFIATKEFETRMQALFSACSDNALDVYVNNTDKDLWECDSMVMKLIDDEQKKEVFRKFYLEKLTNVEDHTAGDLIRSYYAKAVKRNREQLETKQRELIKHEKQKDAAFKKAADEYRKLLEKREAYRMERYGFEMSENGWVNIDTGVVEKWWEEQTLELFAENGIGFDEVYSYICYKDMKSLYRLNSIDKQHFSGGTNSSVIMPKQGKAVVITVGYKGEVPAYDIQEINLGGPVNVVTRLKTSSRAELKEVLKAYDRYTSGTENDITKDLNFMAVYAEENKRRKLREEEDVFMSRLWNVAKPCCMERNGEVLFNANCTSCHALYDMVVGPALAGVTEKYPMDWLIAFTKNSQQMISSGDARAVKIFKEYHESVMSDFEYLSDEQIEAIYAYIKSKSVLQ